MQMKTTLVLLGAVLALGAQARKPNYDEAKVAPYTLEDPLTFADGRRLKDASEWPARRAEIVGIFAREMFGRIPPAPEAVMTELFEEGVALDGLAIRRQYHMWFKKDRTGPRVDWILYLPNRIQGTEPKRENGRIVCEDTAACPVILFLNYRGNHELTTDPEVPVQRGWCRDGAAFSVEGHRVSEKTRARMRRTDVSSPFPLETIIGRGYAVMSACYCEMSPDIEVRRGDKEELAYTGLFELWPKRDPNATDNITAIGAWAWGLSRGLDLAFTIPELDATKSVATGCSRLAKTALLACSRDERFAVCVPNQTGGGGVPLAKRDFGENVSTEMTAFPHWYCAAYGKYIDNEQAMAFDQHLLVASIAPRRILVEGFNQGWFDTKGEWLSCIAASAAWEFLGMPGLPKGDFPVNYDTRCIGSHIGYVRRGGRHGMAGHDWNWILDFADQAFGR
ncbi:MAG: hypothetical protein ACI4RA_09090 [Kiritimatiellia bacterium]